MTDAAHDSANEPRNKPKAPVIQPLSGAGAMADLVRSFDWASTPLGPIEGWSISLRTMVSTLLSSRQPMFLWWGPELIQIYNDAYVPSFGVGKHPQALGQAGRECWPEIWSIIGPQIEDVLLRQQPCWYEDALVPIWRNGQVEDVYWTYGYSPAFDDDGTVAGVLVVCTETTDRVRALKREREARQLAGQVQQRLLRFFEQAPAGICILGGPDFIFEFANEQYCLLVGRKHLIGKPLLEVLPELRGQGFDDLLRQVVHSNEPFFGREVSVKLAAEAGEASSLTERFVTFIYSPLRDIAGFAEGVSVFALDVTDQVLARRKIEAMAEQLQTASRAKDEFLTTASHELRTPLNAILGWARLLRAGQLDASAYARGIEIIERNARAQVRLIEDILDGSRVLTGKLLLEIRQLDFTQLVHAALEAVRPAADAKGIALTVEVDAAAARVTGDPERLQQIVWNLANNAIKFTPKGGNVWVRLRRSGTDIELEVRDDGQGIEPTFLPHVFERFRQAEGSTSRRFGGLGLGLALVRHLVEAHGGTVQAHSEGTGRGATFIASFPVQAVFSAETATARVSPVPEVGQPLASVRLPGISLLVVDDEADARDLVATVLRGAGADVSTAGSAAEALDVLARLPPSIMVSDVGMPEVDGYELMRRVRTQLGALGANLPAIALTAYAREEDRRLALAAGFDAHVAKPVEPADLLRLVASMTGNGAASRPSSPPPQLLRADNLVKLERVLERDGIHAALRFLNDRTPHRFTGIYRFDGPTLRSVQLFDADDASVRQGADAPLVETYCSIVGEFARSFTTADTRRDDRLRAHPARDSVVSYCGVLLRDEQGAPFGTLCHFDLVPCEVPTHELPLMESATSSLMRALKS